jgi:hypothetical protein
MAAAKLPPATTVVRVPPTLLLAASTPWPAILVGVAVVVAVCLWLLFRSGSMADRARVDHPDDESPVVDATDDPDQAPSGDR